jgi:hypothetical protein
MEIIHKEIHDKLNTFYEKNDTPNIIFHGSSGSGKKFIVYTFLNKIYDNDRQKFKKNVMIVNCSHGKGIKFIREELKFFAKANLQYNSNVKFKSILLLNADNLTTDAQSALRRCIELFSATTRFFIIVENKNRLLNPILSRFCEIYVPDYMENGKIVNLHKKFSKMNVVEECITHEYFEKRIYKKMNQQKIMKLCNSVYEDGYSALDFVNYIQCSHIYNNFQKSCMKLVFNKVKTQLKYEKMILMYMMNFVFINKCVIDYDCI